MRQIREPLVLGLALWYFGPDAVHRYITRG